MKWWESLLLSCENLWQSDEQICEGNHTVTNLVSFLQPEKIKKYFVYLLKQYSNTVVYVTHFLTGQQNI